ncbi:MAG: HD domain-containing protein [Ardenticatenaceae bacterium]
MSQPDFERAKQYAFKRLETELAPNLFYHNLGHTVDDVLPGVVRLARMTGITQEEIRLLELAAWFHDIGFVVQHDDHEQIGAQIATQVLPNFCFTAPQIEAIIGMIMATRVPQSPHNLLEKLIADADLDILGREEDFFSKNIALRLEFALYGNPTTDEEWYSSQLKFLESHTYFTDAAKSLRRAGKQKNITQLKRRIKRCRER